MNQQVFKDCTFKGMAGRIKGVMFDDWDRINKQIKLAEDIARNGKAIRLPSTLAPSSCNHHNLSVKDFPALNWLPISPCFWRSWEYESAYHFGILCRHCSPSRNENERERVVSPFQTLRASRLRNTPHEFVSQTFLPQVIV